MRKAFADAVINEFSKNPDTFFLTGDLGFMALENVREAMGERFINCGVAEQNMVGVAAGLARGGFHVFAYSIAPFCYARPFEQIRNDLSMTGLPVCLVGNGGGYGYGHMGPTHHALEDCAAMCALKVHCLIPAFDEDILPQLQKTKQQTPFWLRLGFDVKPAGMSLPPYAPFRRVLHGENGVMVALGPLAGVAASAFCDKDVSCRPSVWAVTELPFLDLPAEFLTEVSSGQALYVIEEHVKQGGLGMQLAYALSEKGVSAKGGFWHRYALGYPSGRYGSQAFHRKECGLDTDALKLLVSEGKP